VTDKKPKLQFLVHAEADTVGVATVDLSAGETARGLYMDTQRGVALVALDDIPLGHKIALRDHKAGEAVIKYEHDIGEVVMDIRQAGHVHVHNLKTKRW
jgi:(2R)-sulfolactate sulfo-lyase subunit alpha